MKEVKSSFIHESAVSPNWRTLVHTRLSLDDAIRNCGVLARGIFGPISTDRMLGNPIYGRAVEVKKLGERERAARRMLVGYLREQGHSKARVANVLNLDIEEMNEWGWNEQDWLIKAQSEAETIGNAEKQAVKLDRKKIVADHVLEVVGTAFGKPIEAIVGPRHFKDLWFPRFAGSHLFVVEGGLGLTETGRRMGNRDHSTISNHVDRANNLLGNVAEFSDPYNESIERLNQIAAQSTSAPIAVYSVA